MKRYCEILGENIKSIQTQKTKIFPTPFTQKLKLWFTLGHKEEGIVTLWKLFSDL